jgi:hypothetical protein
LRRFITTLKKLLIRNGFDEMVIVKRESELWEALTNLVVDLGSRIASTFWVYRNFINKWNEI